MTPVVYLVDDDPQVRRAIERLLASEGLETRTFGDAQSFLLGHDAQRAGCAVIDIGLPDLDGLALQDLLTAGDAARPIIILTGQGTIPTAVRAMRAGAVDVLTKPVEPDLLISAIRAALDRDAERRKRTSDEETGRARLATLTSREREVMEEVITGRLNKQIADRLGAAEKTIKVHRGRMMRKMGVPRSPNS